MRMTAGPVFGNIIPDTGPAVVLVPVVAGPLRRGLGRICDFGVGTFGERPLICAVLIVFVCKSHRWGLLVAVSSRTPTPKSQIDAVPGSWIGMTVPPC